MSNKVFIAIDLKSFYASVECVERGLDPLTTNLVVADISRTEKTICLAVTPSLKSYGISGRARLFEVVQKVKEINLQRRNRINNRQFVGKSANNPEVIQNPNLALDYIVAKPRMSKYMEISTKIFSIYSRYVSPEDIHVYSVDEVFIDATNYPEVKREGAYKFATKLIHAVLNETKITATAGIGTNLYLCKVAMDIVAKHIQADAFGVRIAELDEMSYRKELWSHKPLTDFWRIGKGYATKLEKYGMQTMGDVARVSLNNEDLLYRLFGVNAELLIDHAWGWEPCTIKEIKAYKPSNNSLNSGQVLQNPYSYEKTRIIVQEMTDSLVLDMVRKGLITNRLGLVLNYDSASLENSNYDGVISKDFYGRIVPKEANGTIQLEDYSSSTKIIVEKMLGLYEKIVNKSLLIRRITVIACHVILQKDKPNHEVYEQMDIFTDYDQLKKEAEHKKIEMESEKKIQKVILDLQNQFGKNAILKGYNLLEGATGKQRNEQIGGHKS